MIAGEPPALAGLIPGQEKLILFCQTFENLPDDSFSDLKEFTSLELESGKRARMFTTDVPGINCMTVTANGKRIIAGGKDCIICHDAKTGELVGSIRSGLGIISDLGANADGTIVMACTRAGDLLHWDSSTPTAEKLPDGQTDRPTKIVVSDDGKLALSGDKQGALTLWNLTDKAHIGVVGTHSSEITAIRLHYDNSTAYSGGADGVIKVWDLQAKTLVREIQAHSGQIVGLQLTLGGDFLVSGSVDRRISFWDVTTGKCLRNYEAESEIDFFFLAPETNRIVSLNSNTFLEVWQAPTETIHYSAPLSMSDVQTSESALSAKIAFDEYITKAIETMELGGLLEAVNLVRKARSLPGYQRHPRAMELWQSLAHKLPKKSFLGGWNRLTITGHQNTVNRISLDRDGKTAISAGRDGVLKLWDLSTGRLIGALKMTISDAASLSLSRCSGYLLVLQDGSAEVYKVPRMVLLAAFSHVPLNGQVLDKSELFTLEARFRTIKIVFNSDREDVATFDLNCPPKDVLTCDSRRIFRADGDNIECERTDSEMVVATFKGHTDAVTCIATDYSGGKLVSGSADNTVRTWNTAGVLCERILEGHEAAVSARTSHCRRPVRHVRKRGQNHKDLGPEFRRMPAHILGTRRSHYRRGLEL